VQIEFWPTTGGQEGREGEFSEIIEARVQAESGVACATARHVLRKLDRRGQNYQRRRVLPPAQKSGRPPRHSRWTRWARALSN